MDAPEELFEAYCEGTLTPEQRRELEEWLQADEAHRQAFFAWARFDSMLAARMRDEEIHTSVVNGVSRVLAIGPKDADARRVADGVARALGSSSARRSRRLGLWRILIACAACAVISVGGFLLLRMPEKTPTIATLTRCAEGTHIIRSGRARMAAVPEPVLSGDRITTGAAGGAELVYTGETTAVTLSTGSQVEFAAAAGKRISVMEGTIRCAVAAQPPGGPLVVMTDHARITVHGTRFTVAVGPFGNAGATATRLLVDEGIVTLTAIETRADVTVGAGQAVVAGHNLALTVVPVASGLPAGVRTGQNLLPNGGMETPLDSPASGWDWQDRPGTCLFQDHETVHTGRGSVRMEHFDQADKQVRLIRNDVPLKADTLYRLAFWLKTANLQAEWRNVGVKVLVDDVYLVDSLDHMGATLNATQDWTAYQFTFRTGPAANAFILAGVWHGTGGIAWFDDIELAEVVTPDN